MRGGLGLHDDLKNIFRMHMGLANSEASALGTDQSAIDRGLSNRSICPLPFLDRPFV